MYHSVTFYTDNNRYSTYEDWRLVPETRPVVVPPEPKYNYLDLPGGHGQIDLTESLTGFPLYNRREGEWTFYVLNDYGNWTTRLSEIMTVLQGRLLKAVLDDDPDYYYFGRFHVSDWDSGGETWSMITIAYNVAPFKKGCVEVRPNIIGPTYESVRLNGRNYTDGTHNVKYSVATNGQITINNGTTGSPTSGSSEYEITSTSFEDGYIHPITLDPLKQYVLSGNNSINASVGHPTIKAVLFNDVPFSESNPYVTITPKNTPVLLPTGYKYCALSIYIPASYTFTAGRIYKPMIRIGTDAGDYQSPTGVSAYLTDTGEERL